MQPGTNRRRTEATSLVSQLGDPLARNLGKYRGTVVSSADPLQLGRIQVTVPDVAGLNPATWAMPCFPVAGMFFVPEAGSGVWIEFERGDADHPIWTGCFYGSSNQIPALARNVPTAVPSITIETPSGHGVIISDVPGSTGGIAIKSSTGATLTINETGIHIDNGNGARITLMGPAVDINSGAFTVV